MLIVISAMQKVPYSISYTSKEKKKEQKNQSLAENCKETQWLPLEF